MTSENLPDSHHEDETAFFAPLLASIKIDLVPDLASSIRKLKQHNLLKDENIGTPSAECPVVSSPLFGSYNVAFPIVFSDGTRWILKVPAKGYQDHWCQVSARSLTAEARTMQLLKRKTTIPVPEVYAFDSSIDNELNAPYILMEYINGVPLFEVWFDKAASASTLEKHRRQTLEDLAAAMVQLNDFTFNQSGSLSFDEEGNVVGIRPYQSSDGSLDNESEQAIEIGPFPDTKSCFFHFLDKRQPPNSNLCQGKEMDKMQSGIYKLLRLFLNWIPSHDRGMEFVLTHPDFNPQNVLVTEEGNLCGLIDWDEVITLPRCIGCEGYPSWLTRDWDPVMYVYDPNEESTEQKENSPEELAHYRNLYEKFMQQALDKKADLEQATITGAERSARKSSKVFSTITHNSLMTQNLNIAAGSSLFTCPIVDLIFSKIEEITAAEWDPKPETIDVEKDESEDDNESEDENAGKNLYAHEKMELSGKESDFDSSTNDNDIIKSESTSPPSSIKSGIESFSQNGTKEDDTVIMKVSNDTSHFAFEENSILINIISWFQSTLRSLIGILRPQNDCQSTATVGEVENTPHVAILQSRLPHNNNRSNNDNFDMNTNIIETCEANPNAANDMNEKNGETSTSQENQFDKDETTSDLETEADQENDDDNEEPTSLSSPSLPPFDPDSYDGFGFDFWEVTHALADDALDEDRMRRLKEGFLALFA